MIETIRYGLSVLVLQAHIAPSDAPWTAWISVFAFYTLSGYLMTRVLHERYGFTLVGKGLFIVNRVLRLWPAYLAVALISLVTLALGTITPIYTTLRLPTTALDWITTFTIVGQVGFDNLYSSDIVTLAPNSWSLSVELVCYLLLALYFSKTPGRLVALAWIGLAAISASTAACMSSGMAEMYGPYCFQNRYGVLQAGFIPFAAGGLAFHYEPFVRQALSRYRIFLTGFLGCALLFVLTVPVAQFTIAPFIGTIAIAMVLPLSDRYRNKVTEFLGRASYHLFISHWVIASIAVRYLGLDKGFPLMLFTMCSATALSAVLVPLEHRIEALRSRVRPLQGSEART